MNWVAPCTIKSEDLDLQSTVASVLLSAGPSNIGVLLTPLFSYKRGGVLQEEMKVYNLLIKKDLNMDRSFSLLYKDKPDPRDTRPASYSGRLVLANHIKDSDTAYKGSKLFQVGYTGMAEQLAPRDMQVVEALFFVMQVARLLSVASSPCVGLLPVQLIAAPVCRPAGLGPRGIAWHSGRFYFQHCARRQEV